MTPSAGRLTVPAPTYTFHPPDISIVPLVTEHMGPIARALSLAPVQRRCLASPKPISDLEPMMLFSELPEMTIQLKKNLSDTDHIGEPTLGDLWANQPTLS
jgi:hypothetical protein